ncbi:MAG: STAS domain-containing protein [Desulfuromonadales bacterium]|nr:STAS domain-containing protein [Desulfuromonadales bacterium]
MAIHTNREEIKLSGQWNHAGVLLQIESLSNPHQLSLLLEKDCRIDCSEISSVDKTGLQLLYAWLQCISFRGVKHELINLPEGMQQTIKQLGLENCFSDFNIDAG